MEEYNQSERKNLKRAIKIEYILSVGMVLIINILLPFVVGFFEGSDGISLFELLTFRLAYIIKYGVTFIVCIVNPIRILVAYKEDIKKIISTLKKVLVSFIIVFPIFYGVLVVFDVPISNFIYKMKYEIGKGAYTVSAENYKLPRDFYNELKDRGLLYNDDTENIRYRLNSDHDCANHIRKNDKLVSQKCYEKSTMVGVSDEEYYNSIDEEEITNMDKGSYPVYIYNAILTLPDINEKMRYAALGRYSYNSGDYGNYKSFYNDYYIVCKILYVDGEIYAIIGLGESNDVNKVFEDKEFSPVFFDYNYPYNMILSEKDSITTFYNGSYYPDGSIENGGDRYEMKPNRRVQYVSLYPVRKVKRLDINSINKIAEELQNGVLKESINNHFNK